MKRPLNVWDQNQFRLKLGGVLTLVTQSHTSCRLDSIPHPTNNNIYTHPSPTPVPSRKPHSLQPHLLRHRLTPRRITTISWYHRSSTNIHLLCFPIQEPETPDLASAGGLVARGLGFAAAVGGLEGGDLGCLNTMRQKGCFGGSIGAGSVLEAGRGGWLGRYLFLVV